jgi:hypothetical protein
MALDFHLRYEPFLKSDINGAEGILTCVVSALAPFFIRDVLSLPNSV